MEFPVAQVAQGVSWCSKDRFAAKRLRTIADKLSVEKRAVIEAKSAFRALLNVSPFHVPNELIDFVAEHTSPKLREFKFHKKSIVFTAAMMRKVFGILSGRRPVELLKRSEHSDLREVYKGGSSRPDIPTAAKLLGTCAATDEDTIIRTWDLLCMATVVDPGSSNNVSLEYLGSMTVPTRTHEYAWDELILELAMQEVQKIQNKKAMPLVLESGSTTFDFWISGPFAALGIIYMDHLDFPPNEHAINYSLPRVCNVDAKDFEFVVANDLDRKILKNTTVFGRRPFLDIFRTPYAIDLVYPPAKEAEASAKDDEAKHVYETEVNPSASLNEWLVFPSSQDLEVSGRFKHLYEKHKNIFASDVDATLKNFGTGLKRMHSQRMSALLNDVDAALKEDQGPSVVFSTVDDLDEDQNRDTDMDFGEHGAETGVDHEADAKEDEAKDDEAKDVGAKDVEAKGDEAKEAEAKVVEAKDDEAKVVEARGQEVGAPQPAQTDVPQTAVMFDSATTGGDLCEQQPVDNPVRSGSSDPRWGLAADPPSFDLFKPGDPEYIECPRILVRPSLSPKKPPPSDVDLSCANKPNEAANVDATAHMGADGKSVLCEPTTPAVSKPAVSKPSISAVNLVTNDKQTSSGFDTHEKKNRFKRAAKDDHTPPKMKKIKVSQDVEELYSKFVMHGRKFKKHPKDTICKPFVKIGRYFCTYKAFNESLRPRTYLDSEVMNVWIEKFNHEAKIISQSNPRQKKKYAFNQYMVEKLIVDPAAFDLQGCMKEFKNVCSKFKILKDDLLFFPIVKNLHWIVPCVNMVFKQFHIFDSMRSSKDSSLLEQYARNLFANFSTLVDASNLANFSLALYPLTHIDHPQQTTLFDCGFFCTLYCCNFNGKVMNEFDNNAIPDLRKMIAASLIESRENNEGLEAIMEEDLVKSKNK